MADWQEQLNTILSDPDAMAQIASLAQSISGAPEDAEKAPEKPPMANGSAAAQAPPANGAPFDPEALRSMLSGLDPELLRRLLPLMQQMNRPESSEAAAFLTALRPFLSEAKRAKVERAAQLARLIHLGKTFLISQGQEGPARV